LYNLCQGALKLFWLVVNQRPVKSLYVGVSFILLFPLFWQLPAYHHFGRQMLLQKCKQQKETCENKAASTAVTVLSLRRRSNMMFYIYLLLPQRRQVGHSTGQYEHPSSQQIN
jgi:hypothetical protein